MRHELGDKFATLRELIYAPDLSVSIDGSKPPLDNDELHANPNAASDYKPIPIPTYIPKFDTTTSSYFHRRDPDHEKNEAAKVRAQYKQERKGAIRELRKDAKFLAGVEQRKQIEKDRAYNERMRRVFGSIEDERAEEKRMEKVKAKEKRRAGRR